MRKVLDNLGGGLVMGLLLAASVPVHGSTLYQVALPTSNLNVAGSSRSDIDAINCGNITSSPCNQGGGASGVTTALGGTPASSDTALYGDSFTLNTTGSYIITSVTVYAVDNLSSNNCAPGTSCSASAAASFRSEFGTIGLFFGNLEDANNPGGNTPPGCSGALGGVGNCSFPLVASSLTPANFSITQVGLGNSSTNTACYTAGSSFNLGYLAADGVTCENVYAVTFSGLSIAVGPGSYSFAVDAQVSVASGCAGTSADPNLCGWYNLQSNNGSSAGNPGSAYGAGVWGWDGTDLTGGSIFEPNGLNMDVVINGTILAPEPGSLVLSGLGIAGLALVVIRRRKLAQRDAA